MEVRDFSQVIHLTVNVVFAQYCVRRSGGKPPFLTLSFTRWNLSRSFVTSESLVPGADGADARNVFVDDLRLAGVSDATNAGDGYIQLFAGVHLGLSGAA